MTVAGMVSVITAVLAGSSAGLLAVVISRSRLAPSVITGVLVAAVTLFVLLRVQAAAWRNAASVASALSTTRSKTSRCAGELECGSTRLDEPVRCGG